MGGAAKQLLAVTNTFIPAPTLLIIQINRSDGEIVRI